MAGETIDVPPRVWLSTRPYCNCREQGFVLSVRRSGAKNALPVNIAFFEHRNSDSLCAIRWEGELPIDGSVTAMDIPEAAYHDKWSVTKSWPFLDIASAIDYARQEIGKEIAMAEAAEVGE
jgi:hypothetical protein